MKILLIGALLLFLLVAPTGANILTDILDKLMGKESTETKKLAEEVALQVVKVVSPGSLVLLQRGQEPWILELIDRAVKILHEGMLLPGITFNLTNCSTCIEINTLGSIIHTLNSTITQAQFEGGSGVLYTACSQSIFTTQTVATCQAEVNASGNTFAGNIFLSITPFLTCTTNTSYCVI